MSYATEIARAVVPCDASNDPDVRAFQRRYFGASSRQCDDTFAAWLFERNPHRDDRPVLWVCKRDGVVLGQQASIPVILKVEGMELPASWAIDLLVHPAWRLKGVAPALSSAHVENTAVALGLGLSEAAFKAHLRAGWIDMGWLPTYVRPLDPDVCLQQVDAPKPLRELVPRLLVGGSASVLGYSAHRFTGASLDPIDAFDPRVDEVWIKASREYRLLVKRDFEWLRWRFDEAPNRHEYERYYLVRRRELIGYIVVRLVNWGGSRAAWIVDYLCAPRWLYVLLALILQQMNARCIAAVFIEHLNTRAAMLLKALGCVRITPMSQFVLRVRHGACGLVSALGDPADWLLTRADSDIDHKAAATDVPAPL